MLARTLRNTIKKSAATTKSAFEDFDIGMVDEYLCLNYDSED